MQAVETHDLRHGSSVNLGQTGQRIAASDRVIAVGAGFGLALVLADLETLTDQDLVAAHAVYPLEIRYAGRVLVCQLG